MTEFTKEKTGENQRGKGKLKNAIPGKRMNKVLSFKGEKNESTELEAQNCQGTSSDGGWIGCSLGC